mmetsp:Transcript_4570/g.17265  ORF Transcript_4570/g.17265 Transcript_4570/m.17265 type:complete len:256 (-) Transcript_4570:80-847(-)
MHSLVTMMPLCTRAIQTQTQPTRTQMQFLKPTLIWIPSLALLHPPLEMHSHHRMPTEALSHTVETTHHHSSTKHSEEDHTNNTMELMGSHRTPTEALSSSIPLNSHLVEPMGSTIHSSSRDTEAMDCSIRNKHMEATLNSSTHHRRMEITMEHHKTNRVQILSEGDPAVIPIRLVAMEQIQIHLTQAFNLLEGTQRSSRSRSKSHKSQTPSNLLHLWVNPVSVSPQHHNLEGKATVVEAAMDLETMIFLSEWRIF